MLASAVLGALACFEAAHAQDAGNALNPLPINPATVGRPFDEDGMGTSQPPRSPGGLLHALPRDPGGEAQKSGAGWKLQGSVEAGVLGLRGEAKRQGFRNYKDLGSGPYLGSFALSGEKSPAAAWFEATGGAVGRDDQFYRLDFGRYNDWSASAFYDETPKVYTTTYRSLWSGLGTGTLTLNGLTPGGTTSAAVTQTSIRNRLPGFGFTELGIVRTSAGARLEARLSDAWSFRASVTSRRREGSKPFGAYIAGASVEIPESVSHETHDLRAGLQFNDALSSLNLDLSASFFRNNIDTLTFQNPMFASASNGVPGSTFTQGRFDLAPGNQHYNVKGEYARSLPDFYKGRFTATMALGTMQQNDPLVPPTPFALTGGVVNGVSLANNWNTPAALGRPGADLRVDTRLGDFSFALTPAPALDVKARLRYYETINRGRYDACNPLTGQWGRLLTEGTGASFAAGAGASTNAYNAARCNFDAARALNITPAAGNVPIRTMPFDYKQLNASLGADYRLSRATSVNGSLERETFDRDVRERDRTWEDKLRVGLVERALFDGTLRVTYGHDRKRGSAYNPSPYGQYFSEALGPRPTTGAVGTWINNIGQLQRFDLADRDRDLFNAKANYAFLPNLDGAVGVQLKEEQYPAPYGISGKRRANALTLDLNWQAAARTVLYGGYAYEAGVLKQRSAQTTQTCTIGTAGVTAANFVTFCGDVSATSPFFPESRVWEVNSRDRNDVVTLGGEHDFGRARLAVDFSRSFGRTGITYIYNPTALGLTATQAALAGSGWPDLVFAQTIVNTSLTIPVDNRVALRLFARYESGRTRDWHYQGLDVNPMPATNALYLDAGPQDYRVILLGAFVRVSL